MNMPTPPPTARGITQPKKHDDADAPTTTVTVHTVIMTLTLDQAEALIDGLLQFGDRETAADLMVKVKGAREEAQK